MEKDRLWTIDFTLAVIAGFFLGMLVHSFITTMAVYSMNSFGASEGVAGFTASIAMVGAIAGRLFAGKYMDRIGRRKVAVVSFVLSSAICILYFFANNVVALLAIRFFHGVMGGANHNAMATAVLDFIPPSRKAEGVAIYTLSFSFALAAAPALGMYIAAAWSYETLWLLNCCYAIAGAFIILPIRFAPARFTDKQLVRLREQKGFVGIFEKSAIPLSFMIFVLCICYLSVSAFAEAYTKDAGSQWIAPVFFIIYSISMIVSRPFAGRLIDSRGENYVMIPGILFFAAGLVVFGLANSFSASVASVLIIVSAPLMALGFGTLLPLGSAVAVKYADPARYGNIITTYFIFADAGSGLGALALGFVATGIGLSNTYFVSAAIVFATLAIYWRFHGRYHRPGAGL